MSTVKISQLPQLPSIAANTSNTLFVGVDIPTGTTGKFTATTLAEQLYANNVLVVGNYSHAYPNAVGTFVGTSNNYVQTILENTKNKGTSDIVAQANVSSDTSYFSTLGFAGSEFDNQSAYNSLGNSLDRLDGYLYVQGDTTSAPGGNLVIGTTTAGKVVRFLAGGINKTNIVMTLTSTGPSINSGAHLTFGDGSTQSVAAAPANYTQSAFDAANTAQADLAVNEGINTTQNNNIIAVNQYAASAYALANVGVGVNTTQNTNITSVNQYAASGYAQANTNATNITLVNQFAQSSYNVANAALANTTGTFAGDLTTTGNVITNFVRSKSTTINDNTPLAQFSGSFNTLNPSNSGYIVHAVGREGVTSRIALDTAGAGAVPNFMTRFVRGTNLLPTPVQSGDIIGRFSAFGYGNTAFNTASDVRIDMGAVENFTDAAHGTTIQLWTTPTGANTIRLASSFSFGNTSLLSANTYVGGDLIVNGNVSIRGTTLSLTNTNLSSVGSMTVNGTMILANSNFSNTESALTISATPTVATPSNDGYMLHISGKEGVPSRIVYDSYGAGAYAVVAGRSARGTVASPTAVANNDVLMRVSGNGHGGSANGWAQLGVARIDIVATENYTATNRGSQIQFWNCAIGSNTLQQIATFNGDSIHFSGVVNPQKGFLLTPNIISSNVTTHTIDFVQDSLKKLQINNDCTITLTNFASGKIVEVWVTNLSGSNRTFTHGVSALNSTNNSATATIPATSSAYFKYFSIDGDLANTFVSVIQG